MNQTPPKLIFLVVIAIAVLSLIGVGSLCASLFLHTYADPAILTAIISLSSGLVGSLVTILSSPRTQATDGTHMVTTITTGTPKISSETPTPVVVTNPPSNPVQTEEANTHETSTPNP